MGSSDPSMLNDMMEGTLKQSFTGPSYLDYDPQPYKCRKGQTWDLFLDKLGFRYESGKSSEESPRSSLKADISAFLSCHLTQYLRRGDNSPAFDMLVQGFLKEYGSKWWGEDDREHLAKTHPMRGFLFPRDAERKDST
jgi:hypothetical protein